MKAYCWRTGLLALLLAVPLFTATAAQAVPAFARKTGLECNSCHFGGTNRLTQLGRDFLLRGHRLKSDEGIKKSSEKGIVLSDYMSLAAKFRYTANNGEPSTAFDQESFSIYTGGPLMGKFSYFVEYYFHERGGFTNATGTSTSTTDYRSKLADAYLHYNTNPQGEQYLWARAGQIYPYAIYNASSGGRTTISRPFVINNNAGGGNLYTPRDRAYGVSLGYVLTTNFRVEAGVVNSGGTNARPNFEENNNFKDAFLTVEKDFDEYGSGIGVYGYTGKFLVPAVTGPPAVPQWEDSFSRVGVLGQFVREDFEVSGAYFSGQHKVLAGGHRRPDGYYLEGAYNFRHNLTGFARYDHVYNDLGPNGRTTGATFGISYRLSDVGRAILEFTGTNPGTSGYRRQAQIEINWLF